MDCSNYDENQITNPWKKSEYVHLRKAGGRSLEKCNDFVSKPDIKRADAPHFKYSSQRDSHRHRPFSPDFERYQT